MTAAPGPQERGYLEQLSRLQDDGTTLPRARFILDQRQALQRRPPLPQRLTLQIASYRLAAAVLAGQDWGPWWPLPARICFTLLYSVYAVMAMAIGGLQ